MYILCDKIIEVYSDDFKNFIAKSQDRKKDIDLFVQDCELNPITRRVYTTNTRFTDLERAYNEFKSVRNDEMIYNKNVFEDRHKFFTFRYIILFKVVYDGSKCMEYELIHEVNELTGKRG